MGGLLMSKKQNLTRKLIAEHLLSGEMVPGEEIGLRIDQTLTQDATGTLAYLMFEAMGLPRAMLDGCKAWPCTAIDVQVTQLFEQTPGPGTGEPLK